MPVKLMIDQSSLEITPTGAIGKLIYFVDIEVAGQPVIPDPRAIGNSMGFVPLRLGNVVDFGSVPGCPQMLNVFSAFTQGATGTQNNQMRVTNMKCIPLNNSRKFMVEVTCKSRPRPCIEYDSSLTQRTVETYLAGYNQGVPIRGQMALGCQIPAGYYIPGIQPTEAFNLPRTPLSSQVLRFGASFRISSTYYDDEISDIVANDLRQYSDSVNSDLFILDNDETLWICSDISITSADGGYTNMIGASFAYNLDGWDTVGVYTDPFTGQKQLLPPAVVDQLYKPLAAEAGKAPQPYFAPSNSPAPGFVGGGAAKFPQHPRYSLVPLVNALLNNIPLTKLLAQ